MPATVALPSIVLAAALVASGAGTTAQADDCVERLWSHEGHSASGPTTLELRTSSGGELLYLGVVHSRDPTAPELRDLEDALGRFRPTRIFYEGHETGFVDGRDETIRRFGEPGLVRRLASATGVPAASLEPAPADEVGRLLELAPAVEVELFYLLRESLRMRRQLGLENERLEKAMEELLATRALPGVSQSIATLAELEREFWRHWDYPVRWQEAPEDLVAPVVGSLLFSHRLAVEAAEVRDTHMFRVIARALLAGERVLAVAGANHLRAQSEALECVATVPAPFED